MRSLHASLAAAALALPSAALAHGDHTGPAGLLHVLGSPGHLGPILLAAAAASLLSRRAWATLRRSMRGRQCRQPERNTTV